MIELVEIDGALVDFDDPCAMARALRKMEIKIVSGAGVVRTKFGNDDVQWSNGNIAGLRNLIDDFERKCAAKSGTRTRYAKRVRFI